MAWILGIIGVAWLLIIAEAYVFFNVILAFAPPIHTLGSLTALALLKVGLTLGLGVLWFVVILSLTRLFVASRLRSRPPNSSS